MRRIGNGIASFDRDDAYSQISSYGLLFTKRVLQLQRSEQGPEVIFLRELFHPLLKLLNCAKEFYGRVGYRGNLEIAVALRNVELQRMLFLPDQFGIYEIDEFQCMQGEVTASQRSSTEILQNGVADLMQDILRQICWSFWQAREEFPSETLQDYIAQTMRGM
jgi:hypothetical protein